MCVRLPQHGITTWHTALDLTERCSLPYGSPRGRRKSYHHGAPEQTRKTSTRPRESSRRQHEKQEQALRDERVKLKSACGPQCGPNPSTERHVAGDAGHGQHHAEAWLCQQKNDGERVEGAGAVQYAQTHTGIRPLSRLSPWSSRKRTWLTGAGQTGARLVDAPRQSTRTSPDAVTARVMKCK